MEADPARSPLLIINPAAGAGRSGRRALGLIQRLEDGGLEPEVVSTSGPGDARGLARAAVEAGRLDLVAAGGDGTALEVADGALAAARESGLVPRLGVLPLGTGNALVDHFLANDSGALRPWDRWAGEGSAGLGAGSAVGSAAGSAGGPAPRPAVDPGLSAMDYSVAGLLEGRRRPLDVLLAEHSEGEIHALGTLTLALGPAVAATVNRFLKPLRGAAYHVGALLETARLRPVPFHVELVCLDRCRTIDVLTPLAALQNLSTFGRGMRIAPMARGDDGLAELVLAGPIGRLDLLRTLPKVYDGGHLDHPALRVERFRRLRFLEPTRQPVMVDGEVLALELRSVRLLPTALELML